MGNDMRDRMNSRNFGTSEHAEMLKLISNLLIGNKQFAVTPIPESTTDNRHVGWRVSWPKGN